MKKLITICIKTTVAVMFTVLISTSTFAGTSCVDLNDDGDTEDFGECITVEDEG